MKRLPCVVALLSLCTSLAGAAELKTRNVLLVTIDGLRWQEVFRGAEEGLIGGDKNTGGGVSSGSVAALKADFLAATPEERRQKLMPFFWGTLVPQGLAYGNRDVGSPARVLNAEHVSYPGYNELLTGAPDALVTSNAPIPNRNVTVLEWLNAKPAFQGRVAAAAAWNVFVPILNTPRSRLPLFVTQQQSTAGSVSPRIAEIEGWMNDVPPISSTENFDAFVYHAAVDMIGTYQPRVFLLSLGEPDEWAHARRYDRYLYSIQRCDRFIRQLWEKLQALPQYRGTTTIVLTPDHGRGVTLDDWTSHGKKVPRSEETWFAAFGPDTPALGERKNAPEMHLAQVAPTVAALLGENYRAPVPEAVGPVVEVLGGAVKK